MQWLMCQQSGNVRWKLTFRMTSFPGWYSCHWPISRNSYPVESILDETQSIQGMPWNYMPNNVIVFQKGRMTQPVKLSIQNFLIVFLSFVVVFFFFSPIYFSRMCYDFVHCHCFSHSVQSTPTSTHFPFTHLLIYSFFQPMFAKVQVLIWVLESEQWKKKQDSLLQEADDLMRKMVKTNKQINEIIITDGDKWIKYIS